MLWPRIIADGIVVFHALFVMFVVLGLLVILVGIALRWEWVRNPWFRVAHVSAIGFVAFEAMIGMACPLTVWEGRLRKMTGQQAYADDFLGYWAHRLIFFRAEPWVFTLGYCLFAGTVFAAFFLSPPRWRVGRDGIESKDGPEEFAEGER